MRSRSRLPEELLRDLRMSSTLPSQIHPPQRPKRKTKPAPEIIDIIDSDDELEPASALPTPVARRSELPGIEPGRRSLSPLFTPSASVAPSALFTPSASVEPLFAPSPSVEPLFTPSPSVEPLFTPSPSVEPLFTPLASAAPLPLIADDEDENDKTEAKHVDPLHNPPTFPRLDQFRAYRDASASPASTSASPAPTPDLFFNGRSQSSASLSGSDIASPMEVDEDVKIPLAELERLRLAPAPKPKPRSQNPALARLGPAWIQSRVEANEWLKSYVAKQAAPKPLSKRKPGVGATRERVSGASFTLVHYHVYP
ncbi:hypothetical protein MKEN_01223600 [Mycena kentingensis (nom. inval.)]|nr:hypothetical protein MKEN_01223600 [Mycena kentingensis (nom. inval.)]